ncbi:MAG TPA: acetylglutamate kinase [Candidatus Altiarchaeales archaeon]|nr:acetylglutamate kinase [Candidatus Altiarchaeales archaeon]
MIDIQELIDALHYINKFRGQTFVIKFGGEILDDESVLETVSLDLVLLHDVGIHMVVMHGAGTLISSTMKRLGLEPRFIRGERVTDEKTLEIVIKCLRQVNNRIIEIINREKAIAKGSDDFFFRAKRKRKELGYVGGITSVDSDKILKLIESRYLPVIFPIGIGKDGHALNINADVAAGELARALDATKMIMLTNVDGVLDRNGRLIRQLSMEEAKKLIKEGIVTGGMIPKLESGIKALSVGVERVHIVRAGEHAILGELLTKEGTGTMLTM